ncbi:hypothetical protein ACJ5H2_00105 [Nocardioides sp. R1-1]|uniref:hypothetical protein n=1 Tax=Nocardioides sp. R1-1 TaxID=3383502 RepID=UPI0038D24BF4
MTRDRNARRNRREQLFLDQRHAWVHHMNQIGAADCSGYSTMLGQRRLRCPICMKMKDLDQFDEEHAPQQSGVSILGDATTVVLTCKGCNGGANLKFEREAAHPQIKRHGDLPGGCSVHGTRVDESGSVLKVVDELPLVMSDIKSAFVLAFATLG